MRSLLFLCCLLGVVVSAASAAPTQTAPPATRDIPPSVTLSNSKGFKVVLSPIGATIQNIFVNNCRTGKAVDVALG